jgi:hypothetical protein
VRRSYDAVAAQLGGVTDRDDIPLIVLGYLSTVLARVVLFSVRQGELVGWDARGRRLRRDAVAALHFPISRPSVFQRVVATGTPFVGPLPSDSIEESLVIKLGAEAWPEHVIIVPVRVKGRTAAVLYGEAANAAALAVAREPAWVMTDMMAEAFVRLILHKKQQG